MIIAIEGLIPDRRLGPSQPQSAAPPVPAKMNDAEWRPQQPEPNRSLRKVESGRNGCAVPELFRERTKPGDRIFTSICSRDHYSAGGLSVVNIPSAEPSSARFSQQVWGENS